ncbi:DUF2207 domain-containing protein [soil metagenome]
MKPLLLSLVLLACAVPLQAQERIISYDSEVVVLADGTLDVVERITVRAEGNQIRRGIYRDFPTRYTDRHGNRVRVGFEMVGVQRNGQPEEWFTERLSNGIRINTGGDNFLPLPGEYTFTLHYRTSRQLGFFADNDELYWNAIGTGWIFPVEKGSVEVRLPAEVAPDVMHVEGYTGYQGAQEQSYTAEIVAPGVARYHLTQPLAPQQGFTIVLTFPKGLVAEPDRGQRARWLLTDNLGILVALAGLAALLLYCTRQWRRIGRDPRPGVIIARYQPPEGHTPASLRYVRRMGYDMRCFSSDILSLAVGGHVRIERDKRRFSENWRLERRQVDNGSVAAAAAAATTPSSPAGMTTHLLTPARTQRSLLDNLFKGGRAALELRNTNAAIVQAAQQAHMSALDRDLHPRYFRRNRRSIVLALVIAVATGVLAMMASAVAGGGGVPIVLGIIALMVVTLIVFARLIRAPTAEGRVLLDEIEGLRMYLTVAERDELARIEGPDGPPPLDADRYEALLPHAVALEVEDAWTKKLTAAVGAAAAAAAASRMSWYGGRGATGNIGDFTRAMGSSLTSQISSASSPPGSSSGSGGGGSSGGGGGGGGGGGR